MVVLAAIGTVICLKEVASDPLRLLPFEVTEVTEAASSKTEVDEAPSSSLKLTRLVDFERNSVVDVEVSATSTFVEVV